MSSGADCTIYEKTKGNWYYRLQQWPYGENPEYDTYGPFDTYRAAENDLSNNHQNPGGWSDRALPGCKHDLAQREDPHWEGDKPRYYCDRCGEESPEVEAVWTKWNSALSLAKKKQERARTRYHNANEAWRAAGRVGQAPTLPRELTVSREELALHPKPLTPAQIERARRKRARELHQQLARNAKFRARGKRKAATARARQSRKLAALEAKRQAERERLGMRMAQVVSTPPLQGAMPPLVPWRAPAVTKPAIPAPSPSPRTSPTSDSRLPRNGSIIEKRDRTGKVKARCVVTPKGFVYEGKQYASLSAAAMAAMHDLGLKATAVNGFAWWGLNKPRPVGGKRRHARTPSRLGSLVADINRLVK